VLWEMKSLRVKLGELRIHAASLEIFGDPRGSPEYASIRASIEKDGLLDPLVVTHDKRVISGSLRLTALIELHGPDHEVWVHEREFEDAAQELVHVVKANLMRRVWTPRSKAAAFKAVRCAVPEQGGTKQPRGRPRKGSPSGTFPKGTKSDEAAARVLGIGKHEARALDIIYSTEGVPEQLKVAVDERRVAPTRAAQVIRETLSKQGGAIEDAAPLLTLATSSRRSISEIVLAQSDRAPVEPAGMQADLEAETQLVALIESWIGIRRRWPGVPAKTLLRSLLELERPLADASSEARQLISTFERLQKMQAVRGRMPSR